MLQLIKIEAVAWKCSLKKIFSSILQKSQGNACVGVSFSIKLQPLVYNIDKNKTPVHVFFCEFYEIFKNTNFVENLPKG